MLKDAIEKSKQGVKEAPKSQIQPQNQQFQPKPQAPKSIYKEEDIKKLTDLSFSREKAILALSYSKGNVEMAASILFSGQLD